MGDKPRVVVIGVDEAGRGSLVGEMIVAAFAIERDRLGILRDLGVDDSKRLSPRARERLYWELARIGRFVAVPVKPQDIDRRNLNELTADAIVTALRVLKGRLGGDPVERIVIDRFGDNRNLGPRLRLLGYHAPVIVEEKADARYIEVAAASIIAKRVRDARIEVLRRMYGVEGSGYPSDSRTVAWAMQVAKAGVRLPIVRYSWSTFKGMNVHVRKGKRGAASRTLDEFLG